VVRGRTVVLVERDRQQAVGFELAVGAYTDGGDTDGVVFRVEVGPPSARRVAFERLLQQKQRAEDRGTQSLRLDLDLPPGTPLVLRTMVGPAEDGRWDWAVWRHVRVDPR
jgi:hypothetical protein